MQVKKKKKKRHSKRTERDGHIAEQRNRRWFVRCKMQGREGYCFFDYHATGALGHQTSRKRALRQRCLSNHLLFWGNSQPAVISATRKRPGGHSFVHGSLVGKTDLLLALICVLA